MGCRQGGGAPSDDRGGSPRRVIAYSDLVGEIRTLDLEPQGDRLAHMLGEPGENGTGRGMLTVVVVHKHGDQMPGPGFFPARTLTGPV